MNLDNCPRCGKLFTKNFRDVCPACIRDIDKEYEKCADFLRKNRGATIYEVSEATEVSMKQITKFIREGRISLFDAPNMSYPCEVCGLLIRDNHMCEACRKKLVKSVNQMHSQQETAKKPNSASTAYRIKDHY